MPLGPPAERHDHRPLTAGSPGPEHQVPAGRRNVVITEVRKGVVMDWLLAPQSIFEKFLGMFIAIILFVAIMSLILWIIDRPKIPELVGGRGLPRPGDHRACRSACSTRRSARLTGRSRSARRPSGRTARRSSIRQTGQRSSELVFSLDNYTKVFTEPGFQKVLINTVWWVLLVPIVATAFGLIYAVLVDRTRGEKAGQGTGLPADGHLDGGRINHLEVRVRVPAGRVRRRSVWLTRYWSGSVWIPISSSSPNPGTPSS